MRTHNMDRALLGELTAAAERLGIDVAITSNKGSNKTLQLRLRYGPHELNSKAHVVYGVCNASLGDAKALAERNHILLTDYVAPQLAEELRSRDINFIDSAGNAYLQRPPLLIWIKGQRAPASLKNTQSSARAFRAAGLHVIFALLRRPELVSHSQRELARLLRVAHGTVGTVMKELQGSGFIVEGEKRSRQLVNMRTLLEQWTEAYIKLLRPKMLLGRYRAPSEDWWENIDAHAYGVQLGGESAAALLTEELNPAVTTFYTDKLPVKLIAEHQLQPDAEGNIEIRQRFWSFEQVWNYSALVPPVLIYADLLATGEARCKEAAQAIDAEYMARVIG